MTTIGLLTLTPEPNVTATVLAGLETLLTAATVVTAWVRDTRRTMSSR